MIARVRKGLAPSLLLVCLLSACGGEPELERHRLAAFGTEVTVTVRAGADATGAVTEIDRELQRMHRQWHAWEPGMLGDINRAIAENRSIELPTEAIDLIEDARELERASRGLFNPAIGRLLALWGFHSSRLPEGPPPAASAIAPLVEASPSLKDLEIAGTRLSSDNPAVQLDFGAYLKGVAVERALEQLADAGIEHAIVNAGGDLGVIGKRGDRAWRAAVQHPDGAGGNYLATIEVRDGEFVFTSGNYRRYRQDEGIRHGHIIDPRDGYPADQVSSVTVIGDDGANADAGATALAVATGTEWRALAQNLGIEHVMRVDADGTVWLTPPMAARVRWQAEPGAVRVVSLSGMSMPFEKIGQGHEAPETETLQAVTAKR